MKSHTLYIAAIACICAISLVASNLPIAPVAANTQQQLNDAQKESERLKRELEATKSKGNTLANELARLNNQAKLNQLEIQDTQGQIQNTQSLISQTNGQISDVNKKLANLAQVMEQTQTAASARIKEAYKKSRTSNLASLFTAEDFQSMMRNYEYLKRVEEEDHKVYAEMTQAKQNYENEKAGLEKLKSEKESLQAQLTQQQNQIQSKQNQLTETRNQQSDLLGATKNDESRYAQLLAQNEARIASMRAILSGGIASGQRLGYFRKGETIGYEGNSGCVTGSHLHFSIVRNGGFQNPWGYLGKTVNGVSYGYPHSNYSGSQTQGYNSVHNGIDTARGYGASLVATADGEAFFHIPYSAAQINASAWCPSYAKPANGPQKEIWLKHADGTISLYAHVSGAVTK